MSTSGLLLGGRSFLNCRSVPKVYLAGAISGLTYDQSEDWRDQAIDKLAGKNISGFSPLRAKDYLRDVGNIEQSYTINPLSTDRGIITRDRWDVMTADAVLFYLIGATRVSIGTCIEFGWADAFRKPTVLVMEKEGNIHDHPMVREVSGFRVETLDEGIKILDHILNPMVYGGNRG